MSVSNDSLHHPLERDSMKSLFMEQSAKLITGDLTNSDHNSQLNSIFSVKEQKANTDQQPITKSKLQQLMKLKNSSQDTLMHEDMHGINDGSSQSILEGGRNSEGRQINFTRSALGTVLEQEEDQSYPAQEMKRLRLRISDFNKAPIVDAICQKIWRILIQIQYDEILMELVHHPCALPIDIDLYEAITPLFKKALGIYFSTNYYVAKRETFKHSISNVFYQRFTYDLISMFGVNLFYIQLRTLEFLIRKVYGAVSYNFQGAIKLRRLQDVTVAFTETELQQVVEHQQNLVSQIDVGKVLSHEQGTPISRGEEQNMNLLEDMLNLTQETLKKKALEKMLKKKEVKRVELQNAIFQPFVFYPVEYIKKDPVKMLNSLNTLEINPLKVLPTVTQINEKLHSERSQTLTTHFSQADIQDLKLSPKPVRQALSSTKSIAVEGETNRHNEFKIYEHMQSFNTVDTDQTLDIDEKFKARKKHLEIMKKLEARSEQMKVKKFLNFERLNLKSHIYNESIKTEKIFNQLNAPDQPAVVKKEDTNKFGTEPNRRQQSLAYTVYEPKVIQQHQMTIKNMIQQQSQLLAENQIKEQDRLRRERRASLQQSIAPDTIFNHPVTKSTKKLSIGSIKQTQRLDLIGPGDDLHSLMTRNPRSIREDQDQDQSPRSHQINIEELGARDTPTPIRREQRQKSKEPSKKNQEDHQIGIQSKRTSEDDLLEAKTVGFQVRQQAQNKFMNSSRGVELQIEQNSFDIQQESQVKPMGSYFNLQLKGFGATLNKPMNQTSSRSPAQKAPTDSEKSQRLPNINFIGTEKSSTLGGFGGTQLNKAKWTMQNDQVQKVLRDSQPRGKPDLPGKQSPSRRFNSLIQPQNSFMMPTQGFMQKLREKPIESEDILQGTIFNYGGPKYAVPLHSVVMGDFQLQNWRVLHKQTKQRNGTYV